MNALFRDPQPVEVFGAQAADKYEIDDNPSVYTLLSDVVYTKPNLAVVREYLTNGWDSHKEAGATDACLEVHITDSPPRILFKDFGTGLNHHGMTTVFRYFFRTTKDANDEATGCLGIGSKVAFAATEAFTAIGVKDGRRHVFANAKGADGRPVVNTMTPVPGGVPTDEPNGVTIDIPLPDASAIPDLMSYVQDLRAVSTMKIRLFRAGREVDAPQTCFGETLRDHGFAYATNRISDAWGLSRHASCRAKSPTAASRSARRHASLWEASTSTPRREPSSSPCRANSCASPPAAMRPIATGLPKSKPRLPPPISSSCATSRRERRST